MRASRRSVVAVLMAAGMLVVPLTASAGRDNRSRDGDRTSAKVARATATFDYTDNMRPIGYSARKVPIDNFRPRQGTFNSDLAFWGDTAVQGTYSGFRMIDIDDPDDPEVLVNWEDCASPTNTVGNQGDVIAWGRQGCAAARLHLPLVELGDAGAAAELQQPREPRDPGRRSAAADPAGRVLRRLADVPRAGHADASGHPAGHRPRPGGRAHHRRPRSRGARGRRLRRHAVRVAHRDAGARPAQRPPADLQQLLGEHHVRLTGARIDARLVRRHRHHRGAAGRSVRGVSTCGSKWPATRWRRSITPATTRA